MLLHGFTYKFLTNVTFSDITMDWDESEKRVITITDEQDQMNDSEEELLLNAVLEVDASILNQDTAIMQVRKIQDKHTEPRKDEDQDQLNDSAEDFLVDAAQQAEASILYQDAAIVTARKTTLNPVLESSQEPSLQNSPNKNLDDLIDELEHIPDSNMGPPSDFLKCCSDATRSMKPHLFRNDSCRRKMASIVNIAADSPPAAIMSVRAKLIRKRRISQTPEYRRIKRSRVDIMELINSTKNKLKCVDKTFSCFNCKFTHKDLSKFVIVEPTQWIPKCYKKKGNFYNCIPCSKNRNMEISDFKIQGEKVLHRHHIENRNVYLTSENMTGSCELTYPPSMEIPVGEQKKWNFKNPPQRQNMLLKLPTQLVGSISVSTEQFISASYEQMLYSIEKESSRSLLFKGTVIDKNQKTIQVTPQKPSLLRIKGSQDYYEKKLSESLAFFQQFGPAAVSVSLELTKDVNSIWQSYLEQQNDVAVYEKSDQYYVHEEHNDYEDCTPNCKDTKMHEYLKKENLTDLSLEEPQFNVLCAQYYAKKFQVVSSMVNKVEYFGGDHFVSCIQFPMQQEPICKMIVWSKVFDEVNKSLSTSDWISMEVLKNAEENLSSMITTAMDISDIVQLGFSMVEAEELNGLVRNHQYDLSRGTLPSNHNLFKRPATARISNKDWSVNESSFFTDTMFRVKEYFIEHINSLPANNFFADSKVSLNDVFAEIKTCDEYTLQMDDHFFTLNLPNFEVTSCPIDEVMNYYLMSGYDKLESIYHRALSISRKTSDLTYITERKKLRDCFISSYNPYLLLLIKSKTNVRFIGNNQSSEARQFAFPLKPTNDQLGSNHEEVNITNMIFLVGGTHFKLFYRSCEPVFVSSKFARKKTFVRVKEHLPSKHFRDISTGLWHDIVPDIYDKYLDREQLPQLTFMQFVMWYLPETKDEEVYRSSQETTESSVQIATSSGPDGYLPSLLVLKNGKRLVLLKRPHMVYSETPSVNSDEFIEQNVLFYHPHNSFEDINDKELVYKIFKMKSSDSTQTNIEKVKKQLYPKSSMNLYKALYDSDSFF